MDKVKSPDHYRLNNGLETIEIVKDVLSKEEFHGFCLGNVMKYILRHKKKGQEEDLAKARVYLGWILDKEND